MKILPVLNSTSTFTSHKEQKSKSIIDENKSCNPMYNTLISSDHKTFGDTYHPFKLEYSCHMNGRIKELKIDFTNGGFERTIIHEKYDKDGKNINYNV